jgi:hypothetical protein
VVVLVIGTFCRRADVVIRLAVGISNFIYISKMAKSMRQLDFVKQRIKKGLVFLISAVAMSCWVMLNNLLSPD